MCGKPEILLVYLAKRCQLVPVSVRNRAAAESNERKKKLRNRDSLTAPSPKTLALRRSPRRHEQATPSRSIVGRALFDQVSQVDSPLKRRRTGIVTGDIVVGNLNKDHQAEFDTDLCRMFVACGIPWLVANHPTFQKWSARWIPSAKVPDRRTLSGRVLAQEVIKADARVKEKVQGRLATGQCDGWKNISKASIVATMISVESEVCNFGAVAQTRISLIVSALALSCEYTRCVV
jgi:hypothetical protein